MSDEQDRQKPVAWYDSLSGVTDFHSFKPMRKPSFPDAEWLPLYTASAIRWWLERAARECSAIAQKHLSGGRYASIVADHAVRAGGMVDGSEECASAIRKLIGEVE